MEDFIEIFKLKIKHFCCIYTLISLYILVAENIYINSIYFAAIPCETMLAGLINCDQVAESQKTESTVTQSSQKISHILKKLCVKCMTKIN